MLMDNLSKPEPTLVSREPWWEVPPAPGEDELSCRWGWLELWSDGTFRFNTETRPTEQEIRERKGCRIPRT